MEGTNLGSRVHRVARPRRRPRSTGRPIGPWREEIVFIQLSTPSILDRYLELGVPTVSGEYLVGCAAKGKNIRLLAHIR